VEESLVWAVVKYPKSNLSVVRRAKSPFKPLNGERPIIRLRQVEPRVLLVQSCEVSNLDASGLAFDLLGKVRIP
jgi:hypothetical protein